MKHTEDRTSDKTCTARRRQLTHDELLADNRDLRRRCREAEEALARIECQDRVITSEIARRKQAEAELRHAVEAAEAENLAKSRFLSNISHELRTPMNAILGMTGLALRENLTSNVREYLETAKESADMLLELLNEILDFSRVEAGKLELESVPFSLRCLLEQTIRTLGVRAYEKRLELISEFADDLPDQLVGDPLRLRQIFLNLVGNAIKFTSQGEIVVRAATVSRAAEQVVLEFAVEDTGIGIAAEEREKIFLPFTQADASTTRNFGGTGLGLAIVSNLVGLMHGRVSVESEVGRGSTFSFSVSLGLPPSGADASEASFPAFRQLQELPVLIVSDKVTQRRVLEHTLGHWGMKAVSVGDVPAALTKIHEAASAGDPFPLAVVDADIPRIDGFTLAGWIKNDPRMVGAVIIMGSVTQRQTQSSRCQELGAFYLEKPLSQTNLLRAICQALGQECPLPQPVAELFPDRQKVVPTRPLRILLAEDNLANQKVVAYILQRHGHVVEIACNGHDALERVQIEDFDAVLMDVQMPGMDGLQATAAIRALPNAAKAKLPIIAMTAFAMKGDQERCLAAGMDAYIAKPIDWRELIEVIARRLGVAPESCCPAPVPEAVALSGKTVRAVPRDVFDRDAAVSHCLGQADLFREMVDYFFKESDASIEHIRCALRKDDAGDVAYHAHRLGGTISHLGAASTLRATHRVESIGRSGDLSVADEAVQRLDEQIAALKEIFAEYRPG